MKISCRNLETEFAENIRNLSSSYALFEAYGIEIEYMVVDEKGLNVQSLVSDLDLSLPLNGILTDHELISHVLELKCEEPVPSLRLLGETFSDAVQRWNSVLKTKGACLMPTSMHPWMNPEDALVWSKDNQEIYQLYNRLFNCHRHGWANIQSVHLNLSFATEEEFLWLHAALRLLIPILPSIAASSPIYDNAISPFHDARLIFYDDNQIRFPFINGKIVPETVKSLHGYYQKILSPMYVQIMEEEDSDKLQYEWLNSRAAIARFERCAIELRVLDVQENPQIDVALCDFIVAILKGMRRQYDLKHLEADQILLSSLRDIYLSTIQFGLHARIMDREYLEVFNLRDGGSRNIWSVLLKRYGHLVDNPSTIDIMKKIIEHGNLAERILLSARQGNTVQAIYRHLTMCLANKWFFNSELEVL